MRDYQHTQRGYAILALIGTSSLVLLAIVLAGDVGQEALSLGLAAPYQAVHPPSTGRFAQLTMPASALAR